MMAIRGKMARPPSIEQDAPFRFSLDVSSVCLTEDQFSRLCSDNPELRIELTADRELIIMSPTGLETGWRNSKINQRLANWAEEDGTGICFDSSTLFTLPNGAKRSPDASWIQKIRCERLSPEERSTFAPICPDFVAELRSPSDLLSELKSKMTEYIQNGARLGWLLDPFEKSVHIYRPGQAPECLENPEYVIGADVLPGFKFNFQEIL
jgi:Uma2 family endonuclease